jgi:superfamily II DNA or RNA helicase
VTKRLFSNRQRAALRLISGNQCERCGIELTAFHADHIQPYSKGGKTELKNGQALCPQCNLKKADKEMKKEDYSWQDRCVNAILEALANGKRDFLVNATPGAGKTMMTANLARRMISEDIADFVVVVVPTTTVRDQFIVDMGDAGITLSSIVDSDSFRRMKAEGIGSRVRGFCLTTGMLMATADEMEALTARYRVLHVSDEAHHNGSGLSWGEAALKVSENAVMRLGLSGTPYRTDDREIPFLHYEENGNKREGVPHFEFTFEEARDAGIITAINFSTFAGHVDVIDTEVSKDSLRYDFYDDQVDEQRRLRYALNPASPYLLRLIREADKALQEIRETHKDAAGIVFANTKKQAKVIANHLRAFGRTVRLVIDTTDASESVKEFKASDEEWIVQIRKVYEGANIPRLRVGAYCSAWVTEGFFEQSSKRLVRRIEGVDPNEMPALMFLPADPRLETFALGMGDVKPHVVEDDDSETDPPIDMDGDSDDPEDDGNYFEIVGGSGRLGAAIVGGQKYSPEEVAAVIKYFENDADMRNQTTMMKLNYYKLLKSRGMV